MAKSVLERILPLKHAGSRQGYSKFMDSEVQQISDVHIANCPIDCLFILTQLSRGGQLPPKWACYPNVPRVWAPKLGNFKLNIKMFLSRALLLEAA